MCIYYSLNFWYPTFLREAGRPVLPYLAVTLQQEPGIESVLHDSVCVVVLFVHGVVFAVFELVTALGEIRLS